MDSPRAGEQVHTMNQPATTALSDADLTTVSAGYVFVQAIVKDGIRVMSRCI